MSPPPLQASCGNCVFYRSGYCYLTPPTALVSGSPRGPSEAPPVEWVRPEVGAGDVCVSWRHETLLVNVEGFPRGGSPVLQDDRFTFTPNR